MAASKQKASLLPKNAAEGKRFGIAVSRYHEDLGQKLLDGAQQTLESLGAKKENIAVVWVPGSFELPLTARALLQQGVDAVICLGIIVKGETTHDEYIAREAAHGIALLGQAVGAPVIFGILTTQTLEQAKDRCGGSQGHKGVEAAEAAVQMLVVLEQIKKLPGKSPKNVGFYSA
jgi:6,7-dimethyl-8-ribityllumazine synthase